MTGLRSDRVRNDMRIILGSRQIAWARTYSEVGEGEAFWYENANGLVEVAVNRGRAADLFAVEIGAQVEIAGGDH
jgi:S-adenosylmethionine hydrolase